MASPAINDQPLQISAGHPWPVLSAERGEHDLVTGQATSAGQLLAAMGATSQARARPAARTGRFGVRAARVPRCPIRDRHRRYSHTTLPDDSSLRVTEMPVARAGQPAAWDGTTLHLAHGPCG
jgi:hypothetical protein